MMLAINNSEDEGYIIKRNRIACDLLLARLCRFHPEEARQALVGIKPKANDDELPPLTEIVVKKVEPLLVIEKESKPAKVIQFPIENPRVGYDLDLCPTMKMVTECVCAFYEVTMIDIRSSCRQGFIVVPRHVAMYLCRELTKNSFPQIATFFGGRDHTVPLYAWNKIGAKIGKARGDYFLKDSRKKYRDVFKVDERLTDEVEIIKVRIREAFVANMDSVEEAMNARGVN